MSRLLQSELRPLVKSTLEMHGRNPAMYNVTGIIDFLWGNEPASIYGYSAAHSEEDWNVAIIGSRRTRWRQCAHHTCTNDAQLDSIYCGITHEGE